MHYETEIILYGLAFLATLIFIGGMLGLVYLWTLGKEPSLNTDITFFPWVKNFLKASFVQPQILEAGFLTWISHMMIFYGFMNLLLLTTLQFFLTWLIPSSAGIVDYFKTGDGLILMALWGDIWGLFLLFGILLALFRRYIIRPDFLETISEDAIVIWFLFIITITGFLCEIVRLSVRPDARDAVYSFAVYWMVPLFNGLNLTESHLRYIFFIHGILSLIFIAYIPFSKLKHIFTSPMIYAFVSSGGQYSKK